MRGGFIIYRVVVFLYMSFFGISLFADEAVLPEKKISYGSIPPLFTDLSAHERRRQQQETSKNLEEIFHDVVSGDKKQLAKDARVLSNDSEKLHSFLKEVPSVLAQEGKIVQTYVDRNENMKKIKYILHEYYNEPLLREKKVHISVKQASIRDVIELIGKSIPLNFVVDPDVYGEVSLLSVKDVSAGTALRIALSNNQPPLALFKDDDVWRIGQVKGAHDFVASRLHEIERSDFSDEIYMMHHVRWTETFKGQATKMWHSILGKEAQNSHYYLVIDDESRKLFFGGRKEHLKRFKDFLAHVDVKVPQVNIEARIVVADKHFEDSFGLQWSGAYNRKASVNNGFQFIGTAPSLSAIQNAPTVISNLMNWTYNLFPTSWSKTANTALPLVFGGKDLNTKRLNLVLNAAENSNEIKTILKPSILTNDKEIAEVLEGEVIPIETVIEESVEGRLRNVTTATYKDVGVQLRVRPVVTPDQKAVLLDVFVENSMVSSGNVSTTQNTQTSSSSSSPSYPTIVTTRSKTKVMLASGQTTMISGLIRNRKSDEQTAVPFISKIPIIGWLFKGSRKTVKDLQLLIFITPTIIS